MTTTEPFSSSFPIRGGILLAWYRRERGKLTQEELAARVGGSRSMIAQLESGERQPSSTLLAAVCRALQLGEEEEALLFIAYGKVPSEPGRTLACITALLQFDPGIQPGHREACIAEITACYHHHQSEK
jgi:transcriptional regulator with XRE-family HTH domain